MTDRRVIRQAGIRAAASLVLTTNDDATNILLAVYSRKLNPDAIMVSRITHPADVQAIHRAGADFAVSDSQIKVVIRPGTSTRSTRVPSEHRHAPSQPCRNRPGHRDVHMGQRVRDHLSA